MVYSEALPELRQAGDQDKKSLTGNNGLVFPWRGCFMLNYQGSDKEIFTTQPSSSQKPMMSTYPCQNQTAIYFQSQLQYSIRFQCQNKMSL